MLDLIPVKFGENNRRPVYNLMPTSNFFDEPPKKPRAGRGLGIILNQANQIPDFDQKKLAILQEGKDLLDERSKYPEDLNTYEKSLLDPKFESYAAKLVDLINTGKAQAQQKPKTAIIDSNVHQCGVFSGPATRYGFEEAEYQDLTLYGLKELDPKQEPVFTAAVFLKANGDYYESIVQYRNHNYYLNFEPSET
jgi:hypothetical protein